METKNPSSACPSPALGGDPDEAACSCREVLDLVGSKWSAYIIGRLEESPLRFGELRRAIPGISAKILTQTLRRLDEHGWVHRTVLPRRPPWVEYSLTDLGRSLAVPLEMVRTWAEENLSQISAARQQFQEPEDDAR